MGRRAFRVSCGLRPLVSLRIGPRLPLGDDSTLQVTISADFAPSLVLSLMSSVVGSIVEKKVALEHEVNGDLGNGWLKTNSAGAGAFVLKSWKANESVVMDAFPGYRDGAPTIKRIVVRHVPEPATQRLLIEKGDVDIAENLTPDQIAGLAGDKDVAVITAPQATLIYVGLNLKTPPFQNLKVRQALHDLVDYDGMANSFLQGPVLSARDLLAVGLLGFARQERICVRPGQGESAARRGRLSQRLRRHARHAQFLALPHLSPSRSRRPWRRRA